MDAPTQISLHQAGGSQGGRKFGSGSVLNEAHDRADADDREAAREVDAAEAAQATADNAVETAEAAVRAAEEALDDANTELASAHGVLMSLPTWGWIPFLGWEAAIATGIDVMCAMPGLIHRAARARRELDEARKRLKKAEDNAKRAAEVTREAQRNEDQTREDSQRQRDEADDRYQREQGGTPGFARLPPIPNPDADGFWSRHGEIGRLHALEYDRATHQLKERIAYADTHSRPTVLK
jgi:hypothetical protein